MIVTTAAAADSAHAELSASASAQNAAARFSESKGTTGELRHLDSTSSVGSASVIFFLDVSSSKSFGNIRPLIARRETWCPRRSDVHGTHGAALHPPQGLRTGVAAPQCVVCCCRARSLTSAPSALRGARGDDGMLDNSGSSSLSRGRSSPLCAPRAPGGRCTNLVGAVSDGVPRTPSAESWRCEAGGGSRHQRRARPSATRRRPPTSSPAWASAPPSCSLALNRPSHWPSRRGGPHQDKWMNVLRHCHLTGY